MKFRVLIGKHREGGKTYGKNTENGPIVDHKVNDKKTDMLLRDKEKFQVVDDREDGREKSQVLPNGLKEEAPALNFDAMTVNELREFAANEEIPLGNATKKEDLVRILKAAYGVS